jgi:hypothetical protein
MDAVARSQDSDSLDLARDRHRRLMSAIDLRLGGNRSELHRRLAAIEPRLALTTVQAWCRGPDARHGSPLSELTLRAVLVVLDLPPDWRPPPPDEHGG